MHLHAEHPPPTAPPQNLALDCSDGKRPLFPQIASSAHSFLRWVCPGLFCQQWVAARLAEGDEKTHTTGRSGSKMSFFTEISYLWRDGPWQLLLLLTLFTLCLQFEPSEPYLVPYLTRDKKFTNAEINRQIFPVGVYSMMFFTLLAVPACSILSYRTVIIIGTLGRLATFGILVFGSSLLSMQIMQVTYGLGTASCVVFSCYLFLLVPEEDYQILTSFTQASSLTSFVIAAEIGQLLINRGFALLTILYITVTSVALACVIAFFLPKELPDFQRDGTFHPTLCSSRQGFLRIIRETWQSKSLCLLSIWWTFGTAGFGMIPNYGTSLFDEIDPLSNWNGHVIAAANGAACISALAAVQVSKLAAQTGGVVYIVGSGVVGLLCIIMGSSSSLTVAYPVYVAAVGINQLLLCLVYVQCARSLTNGQFILLFSLNSVVGLVIQSGLQAAVAYLKLPIYDQFYTFGLYLVGLAFAFAVMCYRHYVYSGEITLVPSEREPYLATGNLYASSLSSDYEP